MRRRRAQRFDPPVTALRSPDLHAWVLGLPWVVERRCDASQSGVRSFAVDCEPLGLKRLWLVTGLDEQGSPGGTGVAVILPLEAAWSIEDEGRGRCIALLPSGHALLRFDADSTDTRRETEDLLLDAYSHAMS